MRRGTRGPVIEELHQRLAAAGLPLQGDPAAFFGASTEETVRVFQRSREIQVDGICGPDTWAALAEQRFRLGDRLLATRRPNLRGDDVRELQERLNSLGFDPGRVDGIFGPTTEVALLQFQRDAAITPDGICGPATTLHLSRLGHLADGAIAGMRERETLAATPRQFEGRRIFLASRSHSAEFARRLAELLESQGSLVATITDLIVDAEAAASAVAFDADACLLLQPTADSTWRCSYYGSGRYRSFRGAAIAVAIAQQFADTASNGAVPLAIGFLRETRMPAVVVQICADEATDVTLEAIARGIRDGFERPEHPGGGETSELA